ncbi:MAG: glycosyltransferase [Bacteriovoracaceae bacterium]
MFEKKISVIIPCFNHGKYILETLDSVLKQTYTNFEIIIVDDHSNTDTIEVLKKIENPKIRIFFLETNSGPAYCRNYAIERTSGEYILPLDADDLIEPTFIEKTVAVLNNNPSVEIVYTEFCLFFNDNKAENQKYEKPYSLQEILIENMIPCTALFRKTSWKKVGGFKNDLKIGLEDHEFWIALLELNSTVHQIPEVLFYYRKHKIPGRNDGIKKNDIVNIKSKIANYHPNFYLSNMHLIFMSIHNLKEINFDNNILINQRAKEVKSLTDQYFEAVEKQRILEIELENYKAHYRNIRYNPIVNFLIKIRNLIKGK